MRDLMILLSSVRATLMGLLFLCVGVDLLATNRTVTVVDSKGVRVTDVRVEARHRVLGQMVAGKTNGDGTWVIDLPEGGYSVRAVGDWDGLAEGEGDLTLRVRPAALHTTVTVVSGSRQEELREESALRVEAVTRQQIQSTGYERVSDVLQEIPGVLIRRGNTSTVGGEQIQGIDSRQVLVLQDGLPMVGARGIKSGVVNLNRQTSDRLERVEVAKGSGSSLFGSDAMGGVINMITRDPAGDFDTGFTLSGGSLGLLDGRADMGGRFRNLTWFVNVGHHNLDSYRLIPNSITTVGPDTRRQDGLGKLRYQLNPKLTLGFTANAYRNRDIGQNLSETGPVNGRTNDSVQTYVFVADSVLDNHTTLQARGYFGRYDENNITSPIGRPGPEAFANLNERLYRLDATVSRQWRNHLIQGGGEWAQTQYRGQNRLAGDNIGQQVRATDSWVQDRFTVGSRLTLTAGGRVTSHSLFGSAAVPKAGLVYRLSDSWILRGSFGMGFRAPDLGQLYFRFANPATFYQVIGNPNLNPEHSQSIQAGVLFRQRRYRVGLTLFRNNIRDLIDSQLVGTPRTADQLNSLLVRNNIPAFFNPLLNRQTFVYFNLGRVFTEGIEVDGEFAVNRKLRVSGAYTYLNTKDRNTGLALAQRHRHHGQIRADYQLDRLGVTTNVRGTFFSSWLLNAAAGTRGLPFQIWDAFAAKRLGRGFEAFVAADNFNDSRDGKLLLATPAFDRPDYGRTFRIGLRYRLTRGD